MSEIRPSRYTHFIPGVPFNIIPDFSQLDRDPAEFREKASSPLFDEGVRIDMVGLTTGIRRVGIIEIVEFSIGRDTLANPIVFPGGDLTPHTVYVSLKELAEEEADAVAISMKFRDRRYNGSISEPDFVELKHTGKTGVSQYAWTESGHKGYITLGFRRSEIPELEFLITGIRRPGPLEMLQTKASALWGILYQP